MLVEQIKTPRLLLQALTLEHSAGMFSLWSQAEVCRYSGDVADFYDNPIAMPVSCANESDKIIDFFIQHQALGNGFRWAVLTQANNTFVGALGFNSLGTCVELAYHQHPDFWGNGYMQEASIAALNWAQQNNAQQAEAFIEDENIGSIKLAQRLGFEATGVYSEGAQRYCKQLNNNAERSAKA